MRLQRWWLAGFLLAQLGTILILVGILDEFFKHFHWMSGLGVWVYLCCCGAAGVLVSKAKGVI